MRTIMGLLVGLAFVLGAGQAWGHEGHGEHDESTEQASASGQDQALTGEVVDVFCYLSHSKDGLGKNHADCAKKCIQSGLPVGIKVGNQLYLAAMASHDPANKTLAGFAGRRVTAHGQVMEQDGQHLIAITKVEKAQ